MDNNRMPEELVRPLIRIVDDDMDQLLSLELMLTAEGWDVACYPDAHGFLSTCDSVRPGCLLLDVRMPGLSGLEVQSELVRRNWPIPVVFLTGHGDIEMAVHCVRKGARDFLTKPVDPEKLITTVATVVQEDVERRSMPADPALWQQKLDTLTAREREIIGLVVEGLLNRDIGERLSISEKTVHVHRLSAYRKLGVHSVAELSALTVLVRRGQVTL